MMNQRREHYRISYPDTLRPLILTESKTYKIIDISVDGVRLKTDKAETFSAGNIFSGYIKFYDDPELVDFNGQILRTDNDEIIVFFENPITIQRIKIENLFIAYKLQLSLLMNNLSSENNLSI